MSSNYLSGLLLGVFGIVLVSVLLAMVAKWVRNIYFPKEQPDPGSEAMMEILQFKAKLEKRAAEEERSKDGGKKASEWEPDVGSGWMGPDT